MTLKKANEILEIHQKWRRGGEYVTMASAKDLGIAIDVIIKTLKK
jgi:hypothetical protein